MTAHSSSNRSAMRAVTSSKARRLSARASGKRVRAALVATRPLTLTPVSRTRRFARGRLATKATAAP